MNSRKIQWPKLCFNVGWALLKKQSLLRCTLSFEWRKCTLHANVGFVATSIVPDRQAGSQDSLQCSYYKSRPPPFYPFSNFSSPTSLILHHDQNASLHPRKFCPLRPERQHSHPRVANRHHSIPHHQDSQRPRDPSRPNAQLKRDTLDIHRHRLQARRTKWSFGIRRTRLPNISVLHVDSRSVTSRTARPQYIRTRHER